MTNEEIIDDIRKYIEEVIDNIRKYRGGKR